MGRHETVLRPEQIAEVETLAAVLTAAQMADYFGIGRTTFFAVMDRDPEIAERYKRGKARAVGSIAQSLIAKARGGNIVAMIFYLKTQGGWRETQEVTHSSADGGPIPFTAIRLVPLVADYGAASRRSGLLLDAEAIEQDPGLARSEGDPAAEGSRS